MHPLPTGEFEARKRLTGNEHRGAYAALVLAALFAYGLLVRYNHRRGNENGQIRWIIDAL